MVMWYDIMGRKVGSHHLAMGVLGSIFLGTYMAVGGGKKTSMSNNIPPINASNKDEEGFIQNFLKEAESKHQATKEGVKH